MPEDFLLETSPQATSQNPCYRQIYYHTDTGINESCLAANRNYVRRHNSGIHVQGIYRAASQGRHTGRGRQDHISGLRCAEDGPGGQALHPFQRLHRRQARRHERDELPRGAGEGARRQPGQHHRPADRDPVRRWRNQGRRRFPHVRAEDEGQPGPASRHEAFQEGRWRLHNGRHRRLEVQGPDERLHSPPDGRQRRHAGRPARPAPAHLRHAEGSRKAQRAACRSAS